MKDNKINIICLLLYSCCLLLTTYYLLFSAVPRLITYQGKVTGLDGVGLNDTVDITFTIYDDSTGGANLWQETHTDVIISRGLFDVMLGSITPLDLDFSGTQYWLQVITGTDTLLPRQRVTSQPYAIRAIYADSCYPVITDSLVQEFLAYAADMPDADNDGFNKMRLGGDDCDDMDPYINPSAEEICDSRDNNCDGVIDEGCDTDGDGIMDDGDSSGIVGDNPCSGGATENCDDNCIYFPNPDQADVDGDSIGDICDSCIDADRDGYSRFGYTIGSCPGSTTEYDCNDDSSDVWQMLDYTYRDADGDGYTIPSSGSICSGASLPAGYSNTPNGNDCDDDSNTIWQLLTGYVDEDGDHYGAGTSLQVCSGEELPPGYADNGLDCNDSLPEVHPGVLEICNNLLDDDCNDLTDCFDSACICYISCDDTMEDNDDTTTANDLGYHPDTLHNMTIHAGDDDWYFFWVLESEIDIDITCIFTHADGDINIELYTYYWFFTHVATCSSTTDNEDISYPNDEDTFIFIRVFLESGECNTYDLIISYWF